MATISELRAERGTLVKSIQDLAPKALTADEAKDFDVKTKRVGEIDEQIARIQAADALTATKGHRAGATVPATVETDDYVKDKSLVVGGIVRMYAKSKGDADKAFGYAAQTYGEGHPVADAMGSIKALVTNVGASGGFVVPPDFSTSIISLLYPKTAIRKAGARTLPMPNGTMTVPKMTGGSSATWVGEAKAPGETGPTWGHVVATARKLMALVPVSNDMMRYATPGFDAKVRDDLVLQLALAEDAAFIRSLGTEFTPKGLKAFVTSSNTIASNATYTLSTVSQELAGLQTKIEEANVGMVAPAWIMRPRTKNYLMNVQNANGFYVFKDEMTKGTLLGWPFFTTTQIPANLTVGGNSDCSELYAVDMNEGVIYESRQLELAIATEASYVDSAGATQNAFAQDMSIVRALTAEDFQMDHNEGVALLTGVRWAPTLA